MGSVDAISQALPEVFRPERVNNGSLMRRYAKEPLFLSFALSRSAASSRIREEQRAKGLFELAQKVLPGDPKATTTTKDCDVPVGVSAVVP